MNLDLNYALPVMGAIFVIVGVYFRLGNLKKVYWKSPRSVVGYIPLGLVFIAGGFTNWASQQSKPVYYAYLAVFIALAGITLYLTARPPEFIKPEWTRWVEKHPKSIQKAMAASVDDDDSWKSRVTSQAAVDAWARELARKLPKKK